MKARIDAAEVASGGMKAMLGLETYIHGCGLEANLIHLVKLRVSQLNGCAYCIDMHSKDLRAAGDSEQRLYLLDAWREAPFYSDRERAALAWAEAVTRVSDGHVPDEVFRATRACFSEAEVANLTFVVMTINAWNRLSIALRAPAGTYQPRTAKHT